MKIAVRVIAILVMIACLLVGVGFLVLKSVATGTIKEAYQEAVGENGDMTLEELLTSDAVPEETKQFLQNENVWKVLEAMKVEKTTKIKDIDLTSVLNAIFLVVAVIFLVYALINLLHCIFIGFKSKVFLIVWGVLTLISGSLIIGILFIVRGITLKPEEE